MQFLKGGTIVPVMPCTAHSQLRPLSYMPPRLEYALPEALSIIPFILHAGLVAPDISSVPECPQAS